MHGGARAGAGCPPEIQDTRDAVSGHPQLFSHPSLPTPGVASSSRNIHTLFHGSGQVSPILDPSSGVQSDAMEDVVGSEHSPAATCEFHFLI